jgi:hypothetical protein
MEEEGGGDDAAEGYGSTGGDEVMTGCRYPHTPLVAQKATLTYARHALFVLTTLSPGTEPLA